MLRKVFIAICAAALILVAGLPVTAQTSGTALFYYEPDPGFQDAAIALYDELVIQGFAVGYTSDMTEFSNALASGDDEVYAAFSLDSTQLAVWKSQVPDNSHYISVTLDRSGKLETDYSSFLTPSWRSRASSLTLLSYSSPDSQMTGNGSGHGLTTNGSNSSSTADTTTSMWDPFGIIDGILEAIAGWFGDILEWLECVGTCAIGCADTFLENIPEGVEVEVTIEVQTTPPGVTTSITVKASGQDAVKLMKEYAKLVKCLGECVANC